MGAKKIQNATPTKIVAKRFQTCPEFFSQWSAQNYLGIFEIISFRFLTIFFKHLNSPLYPMEKQKTLIIWKTSGRRANRSQSLGLNRISSTYGVPLVQGHIGVIRCNCNIFRK